MWVPCGYNVFHRPHPVFSSILNVHVSEMLCTCQRCCARFPAVVHVSQKLCTCHRSCAHFTSPLVTFVFNCIRAERILISKRIGATKHVLSICVIIYTIYVYTQYIYIVYIQIIYTLHIYTRYIYIYICRQYIYIHYI